MKKATDVGASIAKNKANTKTSLLSYSL